MTICQQCADSLGLICKTPDYLSQWMGVCSVCNREKGVADRYHDYDEPKARRMTDVEAIWLLSEMEKEALESGDAAQTEPNHRKGGE